MFMYMLIISMHRCTVLYGCSVVCRLSLPLSHRESEVNKGFHDIMDAFQEECTALFYQEDSGIRDQVFEVSITYMYMYMYIHSPPYVQSKAGTTSRAGRAMTLPSILLM